MLRVVESLEHCESLNHLVESLNHLVDCELSGGSGMVVQENHEFNTTYSTK